LINFWSSRRSLQKLFHSSDGSQQLLFDETEHSKLGFTGILEMLKGIIISPDDFDGASVLLSDIPIHIIQSTEDVFVDPKNAMIFQEEMLPANRNLVNNIADSLDTNAVHVNWLQVSSTFGILNE